MMIDISRPSVLTSMSSDELCEAAYRGLIECRGVDLSSFVEKLMQGVQEKIDNAFEEGVAHGRYEAGVEE